MARNFGGVADFSGDVAEVKSPPRYVILQAPFDLTASYVSGAAGGPAAIIEASTHMELYDEELGCEPYRAGIETLGPIGPMDSPEAMVEAVREAAEGVLDGGSIPVLLGGEHSVTLGMVRALKARYPKLSVLQLDAHADLRDTYEGSPYNHACIGRRITEICPLVQVGVRSLSAEEAGFLKSPGEASVKTYYAAEILKSGAGLAASIAAELTDPVFVTIDIDVFDPSVMPSTGTPEPGGLGWYEVIALLKGVASKRNVVGFDLVELCPQPGNVAPDFMAARLVYKMMAYTPQRGV
jgi:agmatinase